MLFTKSDQATTISPAKSIDLPRFRKKVAQIDTTIQVTIYDTSLEYVRHFPDFAK